jgi:hypothetical protein
MSVFSRRTQQRVIGLASGTPLCISVGTRQPWPDRARFATRCPQPIIHRVLSSRGVALIGQLGQRGLAGWAGHVSRRCIRRRS